MSAKIEAMYQQIGQSALDLADGLAGKLLVYAEVEDGVISADLFYVKEGGTVRFRFSSKALQELLYTFWEGWKEEPGNREWRAMSYVVDGGKFKLDLTYPDQINADEDISDRRPLVVKKYFGDAKVDYSKPK
jgi:hypothetical protein